MIAHVEDSAFGVGLTAVAVCPFALGGGPTWAWATAAGCLGLALVLHGVAAAVGGRPKRVARPVVAACAGLLAVAVWTALQAVPGLPGAHPVWTRLDGALASAPAGRWSRTPADAVPAVILLGACAAALWLGAHSPARFRRLAPAAVAAAAGVCAIYALAVLWVGSEQVLWVEKRAYRGAATGTFINRNAFGAFMGVGVMAVVAGVAARWRDGPRGWVGWACVGGVIAAGLLASASRGAIAATVVSVGVVAVVIAARDGSRQAWALAGGAGLAVLAAAGVALDDRVLAIPDALTQRARIYAVGADAVLDRPWLGHGAGSFDAVFRSARPPDLAFVVTHAHSLYLGAAVAWGLPAALALLAASTVLAAGCVRTARAGDALGLAGLGCCVLIAAHGLVDAAPRVPGVALPALWLMGAGCRPRAPG